MKNITASGSIWLPQPLVVAYGLGVNSTAVLIEMKNRGIVPDAILFADTGNEKQATYDYLPVINAWLRNADFPPITIVRYQPKRFKNGLTYSTLGGNCLANGTLPSLAFGMKTCSLKWKIYPQNQWTNRWQPALDYWLTGGKVKKVIGYDATPQDLKRYAHAKDVEDERYEYWYPLIEWGFDRHACEQVIRKAGLPVPPKSACTFCPATQPGELHELSKDDLGYIVLMEANARPKLQGCMTAEELDADFKSRHLAWEKNLLKATGARAQKLRDREPKPKTPGSGCAGLWRNSTKKRPAAMTDYIRMQQLLTGKEIDAFKFQLKENRLFYQNILNH